MQPTIKTVSTDYTFLNTDYTVLVDASGGEKNITLLASDINTRGRICVVKKIDATTNVVWVYGDGTDSIDGVSPLVINTTNESITIQSDGNGKWRIL